MRQQGTVARWDSTKGFGFIKAAGMQDIFFHVRDFHPVQGGLPDVGMKVDFETIHVGGKGPRAMAVRPVGVVPLRAAAAAAPRKPPARQSRPPRSNPHPRHHAGSGAWVALPLMLAYSAALLWGVWRKELPWWTLSASLGLNLAAFFAYWQDKYAAQQQRWRISENTLHLWSLAGGWGGAWWAQQVLRHKSRKESFRAAYWFTVVIHCAAIALWASPELREAVLRVAA